MTVFCPPIGASAKEIREQLASLEGNHLELHLSLPRAQWPAWAKAMTKAPPESLQSLVVRELEFDPSSAIGRAMLGAKASAALWSALGELKSLHLVGHSFASDLALPKLETIRMEGFCLGKAFVKVSPDCPKLRTLEWAFSDDEHGVAIGVSQVKGLWLASGTPNLVDIDLGGADFDGDMCRAPSFMKSKLLTQLERVVLVNIEEDTLKKALPKLAHVRDICVSNRPELTAIDPRISNLDRPSPTPLHLETTGRGYAFGLKDEHVSDAATAMAEYRVTHLRLVAHDVGDEAGALGQALSSQESLEIIDFSWPLIYGLNNGARAFFTALEGHPALRELHLRDNRFPSATAELSALTRSLPNLELLAFTTDTLEEDKIQGLIEAIGEAPKLRALSIFGSATEAEMGEALPLLASASMEKLSLPSIKKWEYPAIARVLEGMSKRLPSLRALDVSNTFPGDASRLKALRTAFDGHPLQLLDLDVFETAEDIDELGELLETLPIETLILDLDQANGKERDSSRLAAAVARGKHLRSLSLDAKPTVEQVSLLFDALSKTPCTTLSDLRSVKTDDASQLDDMAERAAKSNVRTYLRCNFDWIPALLRAGAATSIEVKGQYWLESRVPALVEAIMAGEGLKSLKLTDADELLPAVVGNPHLETIEITWAEPAKLYKLLVDLGKKGGPSTVRAGGKFSEVLANELTTFAASRSIGLTIDHH